MDKNNDLEPVSMYEMFPRLFATMAKHIIERFGEEGKETIKAAVDEFGMERGRDVARRAFAAGATNDVDHYLRCYDMERTNHFEYEDTYKDGAVEQLFTRCVFADTWKKDGTEEYGYLYCQMIDPAIARGYNENMECIHDQHFFKDGKCTFCFKIKDNK